MLMKNKLKLSINHYILCAQKLTGSHKSTARNQKIKIGLTNKNLKQETDIT